MAPASRASNGGGRRRYCYDWDSLQEADRSLCRL